MDYLQTEFNWKDVYYNKVNVVSTPKSIFLPNLALDTNFKVLIYNKCNETCSLCL